MFDFVMPFDNIDSRPLTCQDHRGVNAISQIPRYMLLHIFQYCHGHNHTFNPGCSHTNSAARLMPTDPSHSKRSLLHKQVSTKRQAHSRPAACRRNPATRAVTSISSMVSILSASRARLDEHEYTIYPKMASIKPVEEQLHTFSRTWPSIHPSRSPPLTATIPRPSQTVNHPFLFRRVRGDPSSLWPL